MGRKKNSPLGEVGRRLTPSSLWEGMRGLRLHDVLQVLLNLLIRYLVVAQVAVEV